MAEGDVDDGGSQARRGGGGGGGSKLKTLLKQKDEEDNTPLLLAVQVWALFKFYLHKKNSDFNFKVIHRQVTATQWSFSSTRLTRFVTSTN